MRTFLINASPQQTILPAMADLMIGLEDRLTVLEADGMEALASCVRDRAFGTVQQAFGSDRRLKLILFHEFRPSPDVPKDINDLMADVLAQETDFVGQAMEIIKTVCDQEQAKLETVTFVFGERCSHGLAEAESRSTIANDPANVDLNKNLAALEDPARLQNYFSVRYAYIDMDRLPRNEAVRSDWFFYFQLMTCVCLSVQGAEFPLEARNRNTALDGSTVRKAFALPAFSREKAAHMFSRKIILLRREANRIQRGITGAEPEETPAEEKNGENFPTPLPDMHLAPAETYNPRLFSTWKTNRASALACLNSLRHSNGENLKKLELFQSGTAMSRAGEQLRYRVSQLCRKLTSQSGEVDKQLEQTRQKIEAAVPPLRTLRAAGMALGTCWILYLLLRPFGLSPSFAPLGVLTACLLAGICVFTLVRNARLFPELQPAAKAYKSVWDMAEEQMEALIDEALKERDDGKSSSDKEQTDLRERQAGWHLNRLNRLIGSLRYIAGNVGLDVTDMPALVTEDNTMLVISKGILENAAVYGFSGDEYMELYVPGGESK